MTVTEPPTTGRSYSGIARVMDLNGMLLDVGKAGLQVTDEETGQWSGTLRVFDNSCLESKSLTTMLELGDGSRSKAQVGPMVAEAGNDLIDVKVVGLGAVPF